MKNSYKSINSHKPLRKLLFWAIAMSLLTSRDGWKKGREKEVYVLRGMLNILCITLDVENAKAPKGQSPSIVQLRIETVSKKLNLEDLLETSYCPTFFLAPYVPSKLVGFSINKMQPKWPVPCVGRHSNAAVCCASVFDFDPSTLGFQTPGEGDIWTPKNLHKRPFWWSYLEDKSWASSFRTAFFWDKSQQHFQGILDPRCWRAFQSQGEPWGPTNLVKTQTTRGPLLSVKSWLVQFHFWSLFHGLLYLIIIPDITA